MRLPSITSQETSAEGSEQPRHSVSQHQSEGETNKQKKSRAERAQVFEMEGWRAGASAGLLVVAGGLILVQGGARQQPEQLS